MAPTYKKLSSREEESSGGVEPESESSSSGTKYTVIGLAVLLILALGIGLFLYIRKRTKKTLDDFAKKSGGVAQGKTQKVVGAAALAHGLVKHHVGKR